MSENTGIDQLIDRLNRIEAGLNALETQPEPSDSISAAEIDRLFLEREKELAALRNEMIELHEKVAAGAIVMEERSAEAAGECPQVLKSVLAPGVEDLRTSLETDIQASLDAALAAGERAIENRISVRVSALEKTLADQSESLSALRRRAIDSDANLQRLISAVEDVCAKVEARPRRRLNILENGSVKSVPGGSL